MTRARATIRLLQHVLSVYSDSWVSMQNSFVNTGRLIHVKELNIYTCMRHSYSAINLAYGGSGGMCHGLYAGCSDALEHVSWHRTRVVGCLRDHSIISPFRYFQLNRQPH